MVIQKLTVHIRQDAFNVPNITTSTYQKPRNLPAKCALCQGEHNASYKGCQIHKELQKLRNPNSRSNQPTSIKNQSNPKTTAKAPSAESNPSFSHNRTYANVTSNQEPPKSDSDQPDPGILLSKFISDFQALINPLLSLLITVLAKLAAQNDK